MKLSQEKWRYGTKALTKENQARYFLCVNFKDVVYPWIFTDDYGNACQYADDGTEKYNNPPIVKMEE